MNKEKQWEYELISCSQKVYDKIQQHISRKTENILSPTQEAFHIIQHDLNALHVKARLMKAGVPREILERIIPQYEAKIHPLIYPLIKE